MINKILPFLNKYLPSALAVKGISKVNPKLGGFITDAATIGYSADTILDFLRDKLEPQGVKNEKQRLESQKGTLRPDEVNNLNSLNSRDFTKALPLALGAGAGALTSGILSNQQNPESENIEFNQMESIKKQPEKEIQYQQQLTQQEPQKQNTTEQTNIIKQYSDELYSFLEDKIKKGKDLFVAGASAQINPKFASVIEKMEKDHKTNWSDILTTVFGQGQAKQQQQQAPQPNNQGRDQKKAQLMELLNNLNKSLQG